MLVCLLSTYKDLNSEATDGGESRQKKQKKKSRKPRKTSVFLLGYDSNSMKQSDSHLTGLPGLTSKLMHRMRTTSPKTLEDRM
jgi:hypothetical protein